MPSMASAGFPMFDADNHYYEPTDAFTRHLPKSMAKRTMQWVNLDGRERLLVGGQLSRFIPNPTFDPIAKPGSLYAYFRGQASKDIKQAFGDLDRMADHPEYRDKEARLRVLDEQGVEGCFMFPTLGVGMEQALIGDPEAIQAAFTSFNKWLAEDWGFSTEGRIFAAPLISLCDPDAAVAELERVLAEDARIVCLRPAPAPTPQGNLPPGHPMFDRFWATAAEAGVAIAYHSGDSGQSYITQRWGADEGHKSFGLSTFYLLATADRAIYETVVALLTGGVLTRHPGLRVISIESGSEWVPGLFDKTAKVYKQQPDAFAEHPHETLRRQLWVSPHFEEDKRLLADVLGLEHMIMGSDWPHAEGLVEPGDYRTELERDGFTRDEIEQIMRRNGEQLTKLAPA
jgi:predicted TIM-barrel fold metal-dependent hydrolase